MKIPFIGQKKKWSRRDLVFLLERLGLYVSAGLTIDRAIILAGESSSKWQRPSLELMLNDIQKGGRLAESLLNRVSLPTVFASLIGHGESSGNLILAINSAKAMLENGEEIRGKCLSAMVYPVIIAFMATLMTIGLVRGVMPQIVPMLKGLGADLPILTRSVIHLSDGLMAYGLYVFVILVCFSIFFKLAYKKSIAIKSFVHRSVLSLPIMGKLFRDYALIIFFRSCGYLINSGISSNKAYQNAIGNISFLPLYHYFKSKISDLNRGVSFSRSLSGSNLPSYIAPLISAGESSGSLGASLIRLAIILESDLERNLKRLTSLVEPVMMAGVGLVIGTIAISIMMPIYDISKVLQR